MEDKKRAVSLSDEEIGTVSGGTEVTISSIKTVCPKCHSDQFLREFTGGRIKCTKCNVQIGI